MMEKDSWSQKGNFVQKDIFEYGTLCVGYYIVFVALWKVNY